MSVRLASTRAAPLFQRIGTRSRHVHLPRPLPYPVEKGMGDFLSPEALGVLAVDYQHGLLSRLNDEVRGTDEQNKSVAQTIISTAADRSKTLAFNYASLALNNSFFLDHLAPPPENGTAHESQITPFFGAKINANHGDLSQLKSNFSAAAMGMASSGYVWFATDVWGNTGVLATYGSGTLLVRARANLAPNGPALGEDMETWGSPSPFADQFGQQPSSSSYGQSPYSRPTEGAARAGSMTDSKASYLNVGSHIQPLFCLSVHEHAWMAAGYGVWGKEEYLKRFWTVLDWAKVDASFKSIVRDPTQMLA